LDPVTRHILVPFEDSELSERALEFACSSFPDDIITALCVIDSQTDETAAIGWVKHHRPVRNLGSVAPGVC
jgi:nucleotide-binding universal stress UspA family protein